MTTEQPSDKQVIANERKRVINLVYDRFMLSNIYSTESEADKGILYVYDKALNKGYWQRNGFQLIKEMMAYATNMFSIRAIENMILKMKVLSSDRNTKFDKADGLIVLKNKTLNTLNGKMSKHSHENYKTSYLDIEYKPEIGSKFTRDYIESVTDGIDRETLEEVFGYLLIGDYWLKKMINLYGAKDCSKSVCARLLAYFVGEFNTANISLSSIDRYPDMIGYLDKKWINISGESGDTIIKNASLLKSITGGDTQQVNVKYGHPKTFTNRAKIISHGNGLPIVDLTDSAFMDRNIYIEFPNIFTEKSDTSIIDFLLTEEGRSDMLNMAIIGLKRLRENKNFTEKYSTVDEKIDAYSSISNPTRLFMEMFIDYAFNEYVAKNDLYELYKNWAIAGNLTPLKGNIFKKFVSKDSRIKDTRTKINGKQVRVYKGIAIREDFSGVM